LAEYYLIALSEPDIKTIRRILRIIDKHDIEVLNVVITVRIRNNPRDTGVLGGLTNVNENIYLLKGVLPLPMKQSKS